jgi:hypothetical protein
MRFAKVLILALAAAGLSLSACDSWERKGPAERAGEKVDKGISKLGDKMQEGGEKLQDKAHGD